MLFIFSLNKFTANLRKQLNLKRRMTNKKRRDFENCKTLDLIALKTSFKNKVAKEKIKIEENGFLYTEFALIV